MKHLELEQQLFFCDFYKITPNELLFLEMIILAQEGDAPDLVKRYFELNVESRGTPKEMLYTLQNKGLVLKSFKIPQNGTISFSDIDLNKNMLKRFYQCSFELGEELFFNYPQFATINGNVTGLRTISDTDNSLEDFYRRYGKEIKWNPETHAHIMSLLDWAKENNIINYKLSNFVKNHKWLELEALKNGDVGSINFDAVKVI